MESEPAATSPPALAQVVPLASVLLFLLMSATQAGKPLHLDNMDFPAAAEAVARTGRPVYYRGEDFPERWALYHPPLYVHVLAGWFLVFGSGAAQARLFGAVCAVLFCWLAVKLSRMLLGPEARAAWGLWPVFLLQAYTLQATGILDIDTTVYGPLLLALAGAAVWIGRRRTDPSVAWWEVAVLGVLVALALWAKLTTVWLVAAGLPLLLWPRFRTWRSGLIAAAALAAGTALFLVTYLGYCALVGGDAGYTFDFLVHSFQRGRTVPPYAANLAFMGPFVARWSGLLPWVTAPLVFTPWFPRWFSLSPTSRLQVRALVGMALLGSVYYMGQVMTFGYAPFKYIFVFWPLVLLPLGWMVGRAGLAVSGRGDRALAAGIAGALATAGIAAAVRLQDAHLLPLATTGPGARAMLALPASVALVAAAWCVRRGGRIGAMLWLAAAALQIGFQGGLALRQARAEHSTDYDYGQLGLADAVGYVRAHTREDEAISSMKDVGFQARRRFFENYLALYGGPAEVAKLIAAWEDGSVKLIVFTEENGQDRVRNKPELAEWLFARAELVASPGNYRIYRPLPPAAAPAQEHPPGAPAP